MDNTTTRAHPVQYNSRLQKGGALLPEMRALVRLWHNDASPVELKRQFTQDNVLGKGTRSRMLDVVKRTFLPRYVYGNPPEAWRALRVLEEAGTPLSVMRSLYYFYGARAEALMGDFVRQVVHERYQAGLREITVGQATAFIRQAEGKGHIAPPWSDSVTVRVARGLLAALRDYGILEGKVKKRIAAIYLPPVSFAYIAFILHQEQPAGERLLAHPDWRLFLLSTQAVERAFMEAQQRGLLTYQAAGSIIRIEFPAQEIVEYAYALAKRTY
jgi:hypothetical protein